MRGIRDFQCATMSLHLGTIRETDATMNSSIAPSTAQFDYVMIVGHGRSGTNWLLDVLDTSPLTHVRNEPNEIEGAPLTSLASPWVKRPSQPDLDARWDAAARWAADHIGNRDHHALVPKRYYHAWSTALHLPRAMVRPRIRNAASMLSPSLRAGEWPLPWWAGSQRRMCEALPVLKFTQVPGWACWVLENRPNTRVLHIVRHPGGFLNSWRNRYLAKHETDQVTHENRERLRLIAAEDSGWAKRFGDIDTIALDESELWFWRYAAEVIHETGSSMPNYLFVHYEQMTADPLAWAQRVFEFCDLPWDAAIAARVTGTTGESKAIANAWRDRLSPEDIALIERILDHSPMNTWWD